MSRSYWLSVIAAIGFALTGAVHAEPVGNSPGRNTGTAQAQARPQNSDNARALESIRREIKRFNGALEASIDKPKSPEEKEKDQRDLIAQEAMAFWAMLMFGATVVTVLVTIAGVLLIARTLLYTRDAAESARDMVVEAKATTAAAIEANSEAKRHADLAEQAFKRLERPYLFIEAINVFRLANPGKYNPCLTYKIANRGKLPAILKWSFAELVPTENLKFTAKGVPKIPSGAPRKRGFEVLNLGDIRTYDLFCLRVAK